MEGARMYTYIFTYICGLAAKDAVRREAGVPGLSHGHQQAGGQRSVVRVRRRLRP